MSVKISAPAQRTPAILGRHAVRRDIQGLRAFAVVAVVLNHALAWPVGGFVGVDVFFVVSGFLITAILLRDVERDGRISLGTFYRRRIRRLAPTALTVLLVVSVAGWFVFNRPRAWETIGDAVASFFIVANWDFAITGTDYFHATDAVSPLQHFWTLSVEEQFYLIWPGIVVLLLLILPVTARVGRAGRALIGGTALLIVLASFAWAMLQSASNPTFAFFSTFTRAWEIAVGALLAVFAPVFLRLPARWGGALAWAGLIGVVSSFFVIDPTTMAFPGPAATLPVIATALVLIGGMRRGVDGGGRHALFPLTNPLSVFVGNISYSLYLWHFPVIVFAAVVLPERTGLSLAIVFAAIVVLTLASYFLIEQPLHRSPWLQKFAMTTVVEHVDTPELAPRPIVRESDSLRASRPPGWTPGTRYFPGSSRPGPPVATPAAENTAPEPAPAPAPLPELASEPSGEIARERTVSAHSQRHDAWAAWRAKFGPQMGLSAGGLVVASVAMILAINLALGGALLPTITTTTAANEADPDTTDVTAILQGDLAAAVAATQWPDLSPSMDAVIVRGSQNNPARDCFDPAVSLDAAACTWGDSDAAHHMYLVGDSTAMAYAPTFKKIAEESDGQWRITTVGLYGCRFTDVLVANDGEGVMDACPQRKTDVAELISTDTADLVVVSNAYTLGTTVSGQPLSVTDLVAGTHAETERYNAAGRILYLAPPPVGLSLGSCYSPLTSPANCLSAVDATWREYEQATAIAAASTGDASVSSLLWSCWEDACPAFADGMPTKYDQTHMTVDYAERIAPVVRAQFSELGLLTIGAD